MTRRIFRSICLVAVIVFIATAVLYMGVLYDYFTDVQQSRLRMQTNLAAQGIKNEGYEYLKDLNAEDCRITWINTDGTVLYDSKADYSEMENHLEREEVKQALACGTGESLRYSDTLFERSLYCAQRMENGTVVRLSVAQHSLLTLVLGMMQPVCVIFSIALVISLALAYRLSIKIVQPLNELNLDEPLSNDDYDELSPLLHRIDTQQQQIKQQIIELKKKQNEFDTVTNGMAEGIILLNSRRIILGINPSAARLFGTDSLCIGKSVLTVNHSTELREVLKEAEKGKHCERITELFGGIYQLDATPVISDGIVSGTVILLLDVTEREKSEQIRREFTANVSHELKTPLHTISGCAELMVNGIVKNEDYLRFCKQIYTESQRMIKLVEDIINLSRLDEGQNDMKRERADLYALAEKTTEALLPVADSVGVELILKGGSGIVYGVPQLLQSIIYNLCDNAIKYNRSGGSVTVSVKKIKQNVYLSVADTGIGIPPEHRGRIFERFYRVDKSHSKEIGGTGLGLSIVKHAAKLHDASIELQSELGTGTTVTVIFKEFDETKSLKETPL